MSVTETKEIVQKEITLNMGPQHPTTHGVLRLVLDLQGETVVGCDPRLGYLHRGIEKWMESRTYHQIIPMTDRLEYITCMNNNLGLCGGGREACGDHGAGAGAVHQDD